MSVLTQHSSTSNATASFKFGNLPNNLLVLFSIFIRPVFGITNDIWINSWEIPRIFELLLYFYELRSLCELGFSSPDLVPVEYLSIFCLTLRSFKVALAITINYNESTVTTALFWKILSFWTHFGWLKPIESKIIRCTQLASFIFSENVVWLKKSLIGINKLRYNAVD